MLNVLSSHRFSLKPFLLQWCCLTDMASKENNSDILIKSTLINRCLWRYVCCNVYTGSVSATRGKVALLFGGETDAYLKRGTISRVS